MDELAALQNAVGPILAIKRYRLDVAGFPDVPAIPCLDHEARLHETVAPHAAAYLQDRISGGLHEVVVIPAKRSIEIDLISTWDEASPESRQRLLRIVAERLPGYAIRVNRPSRWRDDRRVIEACRAQVTLREVLLGTELSAIAADVKRLETIGTLMEKHSRVTSWGVRTVTGPLLAAAGVLTFALLGTLSGRIGTAGVTALRYLLLGLLGALFLYYGLKAVQLTGMANRVWKRAAEYELILAERRRQP